MVEQLQTKLVEQQGNLEKALKKNQSLGRKIKHLEEVAAQLKMDNEEYKQYNSIANEEVEKLKEQLLVLENLGKSGVRLSLDQITGGGKRIVCFLTDSCCQSEVCLCYGLDCSFCPFDGVEVG